MIGTHPEGHDCDLCNWARKTEHEQAVEQITLPTFEQEWQDAPRWTTRLTEQQVAEYWFIRGQHAKEVELLVGENSDLRALLRVAREKVKR